MTTGKMQSAVAIWMAAALGLAIGMPPAAAALPAATFVSGTGIDSGDCRITAPCATFQAAHDTTDVGGTINVLSSGSFGPITITKSISIVAQGVTALIQTGGAELCTPTQNFHVAICVNAPAGSTVRLRGLTVKLNSAAASGIMFNTGGSLQIQHSFIQPRGDNAGIRFLPQGASELHVSDTTIADTADGIFIEPQNAGSAGVVINRVHIEKTNFTGIAMLPAGPVVATIQDTMISGSLSQFGNRAGVRAQPNTGKIVSVTVDRTSIQNADLGVDSFRNTATVRVGRSTITGVTRSLTIGNGGQIIVHPTNVFAGNGDDQVGPLHRRR